MAVTKCKVREKRWARRTTEGLRPRACKSPNLAVGYLGTLELMARTPLTPGPRVWPRFLVGSAKTVTFTAIALTASCGTGDSLAPAYVSTSSSGATSGAPSSGLSTSGTGVPTSGAPSNPGTSAPVAPTSSTSAAVAPSTTGSASTLAPTSGATGTSGTPTSANTGSETGGATTSVGETSEPEPEPVCEDVEPPPSDEWPGVTCFDWAVRSGDCDKEWFTDYCDVTCGRCEPESGGGPPGPPDCSGENLPQVSGGEGFATRYWDCCQPHCAQFDGHKCGQDGTSRTGDGTSSCNGGGSFACYDEAPRAISDCLSYGYIAKANPNCGGCYRIQFTGEGEHDQADPGSQMIKGKQMIVKVSNTGSDVAGNQFDLMIPGGGVGMFNACSRQWNNNDLGSQYGGFLTTCTEMHNGFEARKACVREGCMKIPAGPAREGCLWFVDWLEIADNPRFTSQQTDCPF